MGEVLVCLGALVFLGLFYALALGLPPALAPLASLSTVMLAVSLLGMAGLLWPGTLALYLACLGLGAAALLAPGRRKGPRPAGGVQAALGALCAPGFALFWGMGLVLAVLLAVKEPMLAQWDEFSFWGTAAKLTSLNDSLYTINDAGWYKTPTQHPGLIALSYFAQFFGKGYAPWKQYFATDLLYLAAAAALLAPFEKGASGREALAARGKAPAGGAAGGFGLVAGPRQMWSPWVAPVALAGLLTPFFFSVFFRQVYVSRAYLSAYADLPAGVLMGGALVSYYALARRGGAGLWALLPLAALVLVKENALPVAMVAAGLMALDSLLFGRARPKSRKALANIPLASPPAAARAEAGPGGLGFPGEGSLAGVAGGLAGPGKAPMGRRLGRAAGFLLLPMAVFFAWGRYAAWVSPQTPFAEIAGPRPTVGLSPTQALAETLAQLLGLAEKTERYQAVMGRAVEGFWEDGVSMAGAGLATCAVILALFLLAALFGKNRRPVALAGGVGLLGLPAYTLTLVAAFSASYAGSFAGVMDYGRYLSSYYPAWFLLGVYFLAEAMTETPLGQAAETPGPPLGRAPEPDRSPQAPAGTDMARAGNAPAQAEAPGQAGGVSPPDENAAARNMDEPAKDENTPARAELPQTKDMAKAARPAGPARPAAGPRLRALALHGGVLALALALACLFGALVPPGLSLLDYHPSADEAQRALEAQSRAVAEKARPGEWVFFVCQGDDGGLWYQWLHHLLPVPLDYSLTGGASLVPPPAGKQDEAGDGYTSPAELADYLQRSGCSLVLVHTLDDSFRGAYAHLFTDSLTSWQGAPLLYRRNEAGQYTPELHLTTNPTE